MTPLFNELPIRRILVALDASSHSLAALGNAVDLATRVEAELLGLFVEDANLLQLAALPFAREVGGAAGDARPLDAAAMERSLKAQAERSRLALAAAAAPARLRWSFRVVRGEVAAEVVAASFDADLVCIGKMGRQPSGGGKLGPVARTVSAGSPRPVLLAKAAISPRHGVGALFGDTPAAERALWVAVRLARDGGGLSVLIPAPDGATGQRLEDQARRLLSSRGIAAHYRWLDSANAEHLARLMRHDGDALLIADADNPLVPALLEEMDCPVLLVR